MNYARENITAMLGYVPGEQPRDRKYVKLNTNENPYPPSPQVVEVCENLDGRNFSLYPDPVALKLRQAAGSQFDFAPDWVLAGNGSDDLLTIGVRTFVGEGEKAAFFTPSYSLYPVLLGIQGAEPVEIPLTGRFELPGRICERLVDARLVFVTFPNAPSGNMFDQDSLRSLCSKFRGVVWIDEAYVDFARRSCIGFVREFDNVIVSRSFSKSYSLAGIRLGIAYANPDLVQEMMKVKDSYNVNVISQLLGIAALSDRQHMRKNAERTIQTRSRVSERLSEYEFEVFPSQANFVLVRPPVPAARMLGLLREKGILVRHFDTERLRDYLRITIGSDEQMDALLSAVREILDSPRSC